MTTNTTHKKLKKSVPLKAPQKKGKKKQQPKPQFAQTMPKNFKYGLPPPKPQIRPIAINASQSLPSVIATITLPPQNTNIGMDIARAKSLQVMSMPPEVYMGPTKQLQHLTVSDNKNEDNANQKLVVGSYTVLSMLDSGINSLHQLKEDEEAAPSTTTVTSSYADDALEDEDDGGIFPIDL